MKKDWISVKDRLPEIKDGVCPQVLIYEEFDASEADLGTMYRYCIGQFINNGTWIERVNGETTALYDVNAWMPLPEPPEIEFLREYSETVKSHYKEQNKTFEL